MRVRVLGMMELIAVAAVAMALAHATVGRENFADLIGSSPGQRDWEIGRRYFLVMMSGIGLMGGLGVWVERARGRSPSVWGLGRWTWSIVGFTLLLTAISQSASHVFESYLSQRVGPPFQDFQIIESLAWSSAFASALPGAIAAFAITSRLAGLPRDPSPDLREWSGRLFALTFLVWAIVEVVVPWLLSS